MLPPARCDSQTFPPAAPAGSVTRRFAGESERILDFADLQNPEALAREFVGPWAVGLLGAVGIPAHSASASSVTRGLTWEANNDWCQIGHTPVRAYRLRTKLLNRYKIVLIVSRIGELRRVEPSDKLVLMNSE